MLGKVSLCWYNYTHALAFSMSLISGWPISQARSQREGGVQGVSWSPGVNKFDPPEYKFDPSNEKFDPIEV